MVKSHFKKIDILSVQRNSFILKCPGTFRATVLYNLAIYGYLFLELVIVRTIFKVFESLILL